MRRLALVTALALAWAGSASADELSDLKAQLDSAKQLIQQLERRHAGENSRPGGSDRLQVNGLHG